eukprot:Phypoly_transcript_17494.p1 GENE.Phypoly_transcript_17494~~Phypoly_transcript_17494.p1  ORF type:complete len:264 (+),score=33.95 Phypoly_transcript_17494:42-794(+)
MARALRIAMLKCDTFIPPIRQQFGDVDVQFKNLLQIPKIPLAMDTYECKELQFPQKANWSKYNGFVISGSRNSVNESEEWVRQLKETIVGLNEEKRKIVGICFGHQAVAAALGGVVQPNPKGWQISQHAFTINNNVMNVYPLNSHPRDKVSLMCLNKEIVVKNPKGFEVIGSNDLCDVQGLLNDNIMTFQGHPEFTPGLMKALLESRRGIIPDAVLEEGLSKINNPIDQAWLADLIVSFILNEKPITSSK